MFVDFHEPISAATHGLWALLAIPSGYFLVQHTRRKLDKIGVAIFSVTMFFCYASSFLYHAVGRPWVHAFQLCDHLSIFLLIAGTYTPIVFHFCKDYTSLYAVWTLALIGIILRLVTGHNYEFLYLAMGWGGIIFNLDLIKHLLKVDAWLILVGGVLYTVGAILEFLGIPTIVPNLIEHHEVWHVFVMSATSCHYWFLWKRLGKKW